MWAAAGHGVVESHFVEGLNAAGSVDLACGWKKRGKIKWITLRIKVSLTNFERN